MAFNSPVWFNLGVEERPQASACFINSVDDTMESIMDLAKTEAMLFKCGSGTGTNLSTIRSRAREADAAAARPPARSRFMKGFDAFAGVIKSGGKTRRAAKMVILNVDHPDILEFIDCKAGEEKKAWALIDAGYDGGFNAAGPTTRSSSRTRTTRCASPTSSCSAVEADGDWRPTPSPTASRWAPTRRATSCAQMAEAAALCGDPGIQYDTTINGWHTVGEHGPHQRVATPAPSTCSSTTRPATWPA